MRLLVAGLLIILIGGVVGMAVLKKKDTVFPVTKEKVARRNITEVVVANGKIQPVSTVKISPEVSGEIVEMPFKEGDLVKKGQLLVKIRPDNYLATRNSSAANFKYAQANSNNAAANLEKARLEYERNDQLFKQKLISDSDYLTAKTTFDVAKASLEASSQQVAMAAASLQSAESDLSKTRIYSPIDGKIVKLSSQLGERVVGTAMMAGTEIMIVADLSEMEARVDIGENDVVLMALGQRVWLEVDAFRNRRFEGRVTDIANSAKNNDAMTSTAASTTSVEATKFQVKIRVQDKDQFLPGMSVTADIETRSRTNTLSVPIQSVTARSNEQLKPAKTGGSTTNSAAVTNVSVVQTNTVRGSGAKSEEKTKAREVVFVVVGGDHVEMRFVKTGISDDNYYEILEGVNEGEEVVSGSYRAINRDLEDGSKVIQAIPKPDAKTD